MITKKDKNEALIGVLDKDLKLTLSKVLDKAYIFERTDKLQYTNFLNLYQAHKAISILNHLKVDYYVYRVNENAEKCNIFFLPSYIKKGKDIFNNYISCVKITIKQKGEIKHKDYMGSIYNLGIKSEYIGDIFVNDNSAYVFLMSLVETYILNSLEKVGNQIALLEKIDIKEDKQLPISVKFLEKKVIIASTRIDLLLSHVYKISREDVKEKIKKGEVYINCKNIFSSSENVKESDIISFKKYGKLKVMEFGSKTKNGNIVLKINIYD
ncbi:MAG: YlmH/Sll1252 family protein [Clostridia bacterium]